LKLIEALKIVQESARSDRPPLRLFLGTGFTPLHLATFLHAHLQRRLQDRTCEIRTGLFGDLAGSLEAAPEGDAVAVVVELPDLDPRMGLRQVGGVWDPSDVLLGVARQVDRLTAVARSLVGSRSVAVVLPTLPLPPLLPSAPDRVTAFEAALEAQVGRLALGLVEEGVRFGRVHPAGTEGRDLQGELLTGFPYTLTHASRVGEALARLLAPHAPRKALVTDLDDTLWAGALGEVGVEGIAWDLDHHARRHGLYQRALAGLADRGVLLAALTKNDPNLVSRALAERKDLVLPPSRLFPVVAGWEGKAAGFSSVLEALRIGAGDAVFVDDSPMEVAEVRAAHPAATCLLFPPRDGALLPFLETLRGLLGRDGTSPEDAIRAQSLRVPAAEFSREAFLEDSAPELTLDFAPDPRDPRPLELVNKTNQFNLNGRRYTEGEWRSGDAPGQTLVAAYADKYGPLGRVGVLRARTVDRTLLVDVFVLSCRAFSRRIEHQMVAQLLERAGADAVVLDYAETPRNGPFRDFLSGLVGTPASGAVTVPATVFHARCPRLYHRVHHGTAR
jgi:FkbH-like protein